jgi:hypothetical protein
MECDRIGFSGPDSVLPASSLISWERNTPVALRLGDSGPLAEKPISVMTAMKRTVDKYPDHPALGTVVKFEMLCNKHYLTGL